MCIYTSAFFAFLRYDLIKKNNFCNKQFES